MFISDRRWSYCSQIGYCSTTVYCRESSRFSFGFGSLCSPLSENVSGWLTSQLTLSAYCRTAKQHTRYIQYINIFIPGIYDVRPWVDIGCGFSQSVTPQLAVTTHYRQKKSTAKIYPTLFVESVESFQICCECSRSITNRKDVSCYFDNPPPQTAHMYQPWAQGIE